MPSSTQHVFPNGNALLKKLGQEDLQWLQRRSEVVWLKDRQAVSSPAGPSEYVYFPYDSAISGLSVLGDARAVEAVTVGAEGVLPLGLSLYGHDSGLIWEVLIAGFALRVPAQVFRQHLTREGEFSNACRGFGGMVIQDVVETLTCNALHSLSARYARWLLLLQDRVDGDELPVTQERASELLGVSRQSLSSVAATFQKEGLIDQARGRTRVLNRGGIEDHACSCYWDLNRRLKIPV